MKGLSTTCHLSGHQTTMHLVKTQPAALQHPTLVDGMCPETRPISTLISARQQDSLVNETSLFSGQKWKPIGPQKPGPKSATWREQPSLFSRKFLRVFFTQGLSLILDGLTHCALNSQALLYSVFLTLFPEGSYNFR